MKRNVVGARVISRFGWATVESTEQGRYAVQLDTPFAGEPHLEGAKEEFIHPDPYAVLRVLNIAGAGFYSWTGFGAKEELVFHYNSPAKAQNETRFFLDLAGLWVAILPLKFSIESTINRSISR